MALYFGQGCIFCLTCSHPELTKDHVLTSAYVKIFKTVTRNAVNKSVWRKKCTVLHRIQWRIWWCTEFGDKFSTDFFTVLKKAYFSMTILSLNSVMIYWRLIHHWIRWWKLVYFLLWFFWSPNSVHMFALKLMKMIFVKILAPNSVKNYVLHWISWQIKNTSHAHNVCF